MTGLQPTRLNVTGIRRLGRDEAGNSIIEMAFMAPWILFLFMAVIDIGFYTYAAISTQNAARAVALYLSQTTPLTGTAPLDPAVLGCQYALQEIQKVPLPGGAAGDCSDSTKVTLVMARAAVPPDGRPAVSATVTLTTLPMIPIPFVTGQLTITRTVTMRINPGAA